MFNDITNFMLKFTKREATELMIALIVLSFCFAISTVRIDIHRILSLLPIVLIGVSAGTVLHEVGHKFMAMRYGYKSEFKIWPIGLLIGFATAFFGFVFAVPGTANLDTEDLSDEMNGKIKIAGPLTNIVLGLIFILIAALIYPFSLHSQTIHLIYLICTVGFSVNSFLATFNLIPIYSFDGTAVLKWNIGFWIIAFAIGAIMMLSSMTIGAENMVLMIMGLT